MSEGEVDEEMMTEQALPKGIMQHLESHFMSQRDCWKEKVLSDRAAMWT